MFSDVLKIMSGDCSLLAEDMQGMSHEAATGKKASRKSLEPITRLRKDIKELKEAEEEDPNVQFVNDKLRDIFGG